MTELNNNPALFMSRSKRKKRRGGREREEKQMRKLRNSDYLNMQRGESNVDDFFELLKPCILCLLNTVIEAL